MDINSAAEQLAAIVKKYPADYIDARLEESRSSNIMYRGKNLESIGRSSAVGGNVRALVKGGWGFVSFNDLENLPSRVEAAVIQAKLAAEKSQWLDFFKAVKLILQPDTTNI